MMLFNGTLNTSTFCFFKFSHLWQAEHLCFMRIVLVLLYLTAFSALTGYIIYKIVSQF